MRYGKLKSTIGIMSIAVLSLAVFTVSRPGISSAETQWRVGVSGDERGISGFNLSIGEYYDVPEREVVVIHERGIDEEDLPVVFFLSHHAHVAPGIIVDLRLRGMSWMDITLHYGLGPEIYYVPVTVVRHYPHGKAWGYYKKHPRREDWRRIELRDRDIVNQVNLKFISEHYRYKPEQVMQYRSQGRKFPVIDRDVWNRHHARGGDRYLYSGEKYRHDENREREYRERYYRPEKDKYKKQAADRKDKRNVRIEGKDYRHDQKISKQERKETRKDVKVRKKDKIKDDRGGRKDR